MGGIAQLTNTGAAVITVLGGVIQTISQIVGAPLFEHWITKSSKAARWRSAILGFISFLLGVGLVFVGIVIAPSDEPPPVRIVSPNTGDLVAPNRPIKGASQGLNTREQTIWIVVAPQSTARFYPQKGPVPIQPDGEWTSLPVYIGVQGQKGDQRDSVFDIIVVVANNAARQEFASYLSRIASGVSPGLDELPEGAIEYDRATVIVGPLTSRASASP